MSFKSRMILFRALLAMIGARVLPTNALSDRIAVECHPDLVEHVQQLAASFDIKLVKEQAA